MTDRKNDPKIFYFTNGNISSRHCNIKIFNITFVKLLTKIILTLVEPKQIIPWNYIKFVWMLLFKTDCSAEGCSVKDL